MPPAEDMLVMRDVMVAKGAVKPTSKLAAIAKIQDFHNDPVLFGGYAKHPKLLDWVEKFVGPDVKSIHNMLINKPPGVDGRHPLHQDLLYFPFRPADRIVATWTALEPCTRENGCLVVVPGTHKGELLEHELPDWDYVNFLYVGVKGMGAVRRSASISRWSRATPSSFTRSCCMARARTARAASAARSRRTTRAPAAATCRASPRSARAGRTCWCAGRTHAGCI